MNLTAFLNPLKEDNLKFPASSRFIDPDGNPILWEIKSISSERDEAIRKECTVKKPSARRGQLVQETDIEKYIALLAAECTVFPNLFDKQLQDAYNVMGAEKLLKAMLKPGEYAAYIQKVQEINGFTQSMDELIDEAKN